MAFAVAFLQYQKNRKQFGCLTSVGQKFDRHNKNEEISNKTMH